MNTGGATGDIYFRNDSDVFVAEHNCGWTFARASGDLHGDLLPEVYVTNDLGSDRLYLNTLSQGSRGFQLIEGTRRIPDPRSEVLGKDTFKRNGCRVCRYQ